MNSKLFFNEIRKIIREEVNIALKQVIAESKSPHVQVTENKGKSSLQEMLNETARQVSGQVSGPEDDKTLFFSSLNAKNFGYETETPIKKQVVDIDGRQIPAEALDSSVVDALTKDYSKVMKRMNELKKKKYG